MNEVARCRMLLVTAIIGSVGGCCLGSRGGEPATSVPVEPTEPSTSPPPETPSADASPFIREAAAIENAGTCDYYTRCCTDADRSGDSQLADDTREACMFDAPDRTSDDPPAPEQRESVLLDAVTHGRARFDATAGARCLAALRAVMPAISAACSGPHPRGSVPVPEWRELDACRDVFAGTLAEGATCAVDEECAAGSCAVHDVVHEGGGMIEVEIESACRAFVGLGERCGAEEGAECRPPLGCFDYHCVAVPRPGEACRPSHDGCGLGGTICISTGDGADHGTCALPLGAGETCLHDRECDSRHCDDGHCRAECTGPSAGG